MPVTIQQFLSFSTLTTSSMATLSKTSLTLVGVVVVVLIVAGIGGVFYLRRKQTASGQSKRMIPFDTSILPKIPREDVASVFSRSNLRNPTTKHAALQTSQAAPQPVAPTASPSYNAVPAVPAAPPETPRPTPVQAPARMPDGYNAQGTLPNGAQASPSPSLLTRLPETPRPHPQVSHNSQPNQQLMGHETVLEAMIRQAQRGIFATPGKDDLS